MKTVQRFIVKGKGLSFGVYDTKRIVAPMLFAKSEQKAARECAAELNTNRKEP